MTTIYTYYKLQNIAGWCKGLAFEAHDLKIPIRVRTPLQHFEYAKSFLM